jgi:signal transduction histidine kinase
LSTARKALLGSIVAGLGALFGLAIWLALHRPPGFDVVQPGDFIWSAPFFAFAAIGAVILARRPGNRVGWVTVGIGIAVGLGLAATELGRLQSLGHGSEGTLLFLGGDGGIKVGLTLMAVLLVIFPDGRLPGPGWRWALWFLAGVAALAVLGGVLSTSRPDQGHLPSSPLALPAAAAISGFFAGRPGLVLFSVALLCCTAAPFRRYRRGDEQLRQQLRWVAWSAVLLAIAELIATSFGQVPGLPGWAATALLVAPALAGIAIPVSIGIAVLRYRLYDVDAVLSRTLAYGVLAAVIAAVYLVLVVAIGTWVGSRSGSNVLLPMLATALVAIAFQPARRRLERLADRLIYGHRSTPYELLSRFTLRAASEYPDEHALDRLAQALGEGLGANAVAVVLVGEAGGTLPAAVWPAGSSPSDGWALASAAVRHAGEVIGDLRVWRTARLSQTEERLLDELAAHSSLLIRNVRLTAELRLRLDELRASRQRLVAAQDDERRRIERNLHDGAQQQLIAIGGRLGLAEGRAVDPQTAQLFAELKAEVAVALDDLRGIGRGLYPPLLEAQGLRPALAALARRAVLPVSLEVSSERFDRTAEGALYFCISEALQNACRHSGGNTVAIVVGGTGDRLDFSVRDNGHGISEGGADKAGARGAGLQNMADRLAAIGGRLVIESSESGTEVAGWCPARMSAAVPSAGEG